MTCFEKLNHLQDFFKAKVLLYKLTGLPSLEVRLRNLTWKFWPRKAAVQFGNGKKLLFLDGLEVFERQVASPSGSCLMLCHHRDPFGEPAWNAMLRHPASNDVGKLVPQGATPIECVFWSCAGRIHHDAGTKTDAQGAQPWQAESSHCEVF